eukprot:2792951-Amphidinium_carterae.1
MNTLRLNWTYSAEKPLWTSFLNAPTIQALGTWTVWWSCISVLALPGSLYTAIRAIPLLFGANGKTAWLIDNGADLVLATLTSMCRGLVVRKGDFARLHGIRYESSSNNGLKTTAKTLAS